MGREKVLVVTLDKDVEAAPIHAAFQKCEKTGERMLEITYNMDRTNAGEVLSLVQGLGFGIIDVTTREADLEDVFVSLTSSAAVAA
jgi:ABC-2 type transport system ATP-binding protein